MGIPPARALRALTLAIPCGVWLSRALDRRAIRVRGPGGRPVAFKPTLRHGRLTVRLARSAPRVTVTLASPALHLSARLARAIARGAVKRLAFHVGVTDRARTTTRILLELKAS